MRPQVDTPDARAARIAARQHGVITSVQLRECGISAQATKRRLAGSRLHRVHRGVYAVGHTGLSIEGRWLAAVLACGERALLSFASAAALWELLPPHGGPVQVSVPGGGGRRTGSGIHLRRCPTLTQEQATRHRGIPVTTPARTIIDIRRTVSGAELRRAVRQAAVLGLPIGEVPERDRTRSELEFLFLGLCERHALPSPDVNARVGRFIVDFIWPDLRVVVETDGYHYHRGRTAFESDRARDVELRALGFEVIHLSHSQVVEEPERVARALRVALSPGRSGD